MHTFVLGAGGVGCWLASRLALAGQRTTLLARGATLHALQANGLTALRVDGSVIGVARAPALVAVAAVDEAAADVDVLIVAVKTHQLDAAMPQIAAVLRRSPAALVLPFLNGVTACDAIRAGLEREGEAEAADSVFAGIARCIAYTSAPGTVVLQAELDLTIGPTRAGASAAQLHALRRVGRVLSEQARVKCHVVESASTMQVSLWSKFLVTGCIGPLTAAARAPVDVVVSLPETRAVARQLMEEMVAVGVAGGVEMPADAVENALAIVGRAAAGSTYSTTRDILGGRASELLEFCGTCVRLGGELGVPTPCHAQLLATLLPQERLARGELAYELRGC